MNLHFTGVGDLVRDNGHSNQFDVLTNRSPQSVRFVLRRALRKYVPYYAKNYILYPALAGPLWPKVLLGNWLAETMRDVYTAASILCGHVGPEVGAKLGKVAYKHLDKAVDELVATFVKSVRDGSVALSDPETLFSTLRPLGTDAVALIFARRMERALQALVASDGLGLLASKPKTTRRKSS